MRIAFLCGGLEPGGDGVGDYTRLLAEECSRQCHECLLIALNDRCVKTIDEGYPSETTEKEPCQILRLPSLLPWPERGQAARRCLDDFDPAWISIQFVCYAFHSRGLVHGLARQLQPLVAGRKVQMMFHEVWLCQELGWTGRARWIGALQRLLIQRLVRMLRPALVQTSNAVYVHLLTRAGIPADLLPLFGNVLPNAPRPTSKIEALIQASIPEAQRRERFWCFGFFGTIHPQWPPEPLLRRLIDAAHLAGKIPVLLSIGRLGATGEVLWKKLAKAYCGEMPLLRLGEQPPALISEFLDYLDFGISTSPLSLLGKSGSAIAMLEHRLPVIVNRTDLQALGDIREEQNPQVILCNERLEERLATSTKSARGSRLPTVASAFLAALAEHEGTSPVRRPVNLGGPK